jgi:hypothetical protein
MVRAETGKYGFRLMEGIDKLRETAYVEMGPTGISQQAGRRLLTYKQHEVPSFAQEVFLEQLEIVQSSSEDKQAGCSALR